jgi:hypothetical protein
MTKHLRCPLEKWHRELMRERLPMGQIRAAVLSMAGAESPASALGNRSCTQVLLHPRHREATWHFQTPNASFATCF